MVEPLPSPPARSPRDPLRLLDDAAGPVLALVHDEITGITGRLPQGATVLRMPVVEDPGDGRWGTVVLLAPDRDALQRMVATLPRVRAARNFAIYLQYAHEAVPLAPRPDWERLTHVSTRRDEDQFVDLARFATWMNPKQVFSEFARQAVRRTVTPHQGVRVGVHGGALAPPGEVHAVRLDALDAASDEDRDVPPDVVVTDQVPAPTLLEHHVTGRAPVVLDASSGPLAIGALDERILNPHGFDRLAAERCGELVVRGRAVLVRAGDREIRSSGRRGATEEMVRALRPHRGLSPAWPTDNDPGFARTVAGLAMAGVPLVTEAVPDWARGLLGERVSAALVAPVNLEDELAREEHSVVLRRAALTEFSMPGWRARVATIAGLRPPAVPTVSVVLATKRPDQVGHALAQVRRQRGVDLELVLAPHGFEVDPGRVAELAGDRVHTVVLPCDADMLFGDVLAAAAAAAGGDLVLKMDDDDWYGPDVVTDLVLAKGYSGADLVGMPAEYLYLVPLDVTVRRNDESEEAGRFVAGGTMMLDRALLRGLGNFRPVRRFVDASLLSDLLAAGGTVYRTQGLGYVFRRGESGHTWAADMDFFLDPRRLRARWDGFVPSRLLEAD